MVRCVGSLPAVENEGAVSLLMMMARGPAASRGRPPSRLGYTRAHLQRAAQQFLAVQFQQRFVGLFFGFELDEAV
jgi:hypothetical protein